MALMAPKPIILFALIYICHIFPSTFTSSQGLGFCFETQGLQDKPNALDVCDSSMYIPE